jgi:hypothetical protein
MGKIVKYISRKLVGYKVENKNPRLTHVTDPFSREILGSTKGEKFREPSSFSRILLHVGG